MILHKNINAIFLDSKTQFVSNKYEIEADTFAMQLLISKEEIDSYCKEYTIEEISKIIGYSQKLIELRLK
jgi:Zn-dependent peptidase ImmA (M78 family)